MPDIVLVLDNVRSAHNVGALLRTAEGLGLKHVVLCGLTPRPRLSNDDRLPHVIAAAERKISKASLGTEQHLQLSHFPRLKPALTWLASDGYRLVGLELAPQAQDIRQLQPPAKQLALVVGHERRGLTQATLRQMDDVVMIPMRGRHPSFNVVAATAMALYQLSI